LWRRRAGQFWSEAAARRRPKKIGGGGGTEVLLFRILIAKLFQQRTPVFKLCMLKSYLLRLSGLKFDKNIIKTGLQ